MTQNAVGPGQYVSGSTDSRKGLVTHIQHRGKGAVAVAPNGQVGSARGRAHHHEFLLGLVQTGNAGVGEAAQNGGIVEVNTVDQEDRSFIWGILYKGRTVTVTGEPGYTPSEK